MTEKEFIEEVKKLGIEVTDGELNLLDNFYNLLIEWNQKINLTRITEKKEVYLKHFYDSLTINKVIDLNKVKTMCDVGTGAGFPGIVIKIIFPNIKNPHLKITLIDSLQKRVNYLNGIIKIMKLDNIKAIHIRGEEHKEKYDIVTSRAVANIEKLTKYTMHLLNNNGQMIAMKGDIDKELTPEVERKLLKKYKIIKIEKFLLPIENSQRSLIKLENK